ncbi:MAG TPA: hypothetical protein PLU22_11390, partial [Polyangiaceae bacterium]|nr:hypothetical protein [Polyangiaceae bacterium]
MVLLALTAACAPVPVPSPHPGVGAEPGLESSAPGSPPSATPAAAPSASAGAPSRTTPDSALGGAIETLCGSRPGCTVAAVHPAGASPDGVPLA